MLGVDFARFIFFSRQQWLTAPLRAWCAQEGGHSNRPFVSTLDTPATRKTRRTSRDGSVRDARLENRRVIPIAGSELACVFRLQSRGEEEKQGWPEGKHLRGSYCGGIVPAIMRRTRDICGSNRVRAGNP